MVMGLGHHLADALHNSIINTYGPALSDPG